MSDQNAQPDTAPTLTVNMGGAHFIKLKNLSLKNFCDQLSIPDCIFPRGFHHVLLFYFLGCQCRFARRIAANFRANHYAIRIYYNRF